MIHRKTPLTPVSTADLEIMRSLLCELPAAAGAAMVRYYGQAASELQAIQGSGLSIDQFREIRAALRARFFTRTRRLAS
jgi:hypothetical protein